MSNALLVGLCKIIIKEKKPYRTSTVRNLGQPSSPTLHVAVAAAVAVESPFENGKKNQRLPI